MHLLVGNLRLVSSWPSLSDSEPGWCPFYCTLGRGQPVGHLAPQSINTLCWVNTTLCTEPCPEPVAVNGTGGLHGREVDALSHYFPQKEPKVGAWLIGHQS